jgi:hypothetical protein
VLVFVYGEPAAQTVADHWGGEQELFHRHIAKEGYVVVSVDNRGTPAPRGREWRKIIYGSVGARAQVSLSRFIARCGLGLERRRLEYSESDVSLARFVQSGNERRSGGRPAAL